MAKLEKELDRIAKGWLVHGKSWVVDQLAELVKEEIKQAKTAWYDEFIERLNKVKDKL